MTNKVHGFSWPEQALTGNLNTYVVRTLLDITPLASDSTYSPAYNLGAGPNYSDVRVVDSQYRLDKLVETISGRGQPVILGNVVQTTETYTGSSYDLPAASGLSGSFTVYNLLFTIEHNQSWEVQGNNETLAESLNDLNLASSTGFIYTTPTSNNNVSVQLVTPAIASTILLAALAVPTIKVF